jgi:adenylate kinase family enzyme
MSKNLQKIIDRLNTGNYTPDDVLEISSAISAGKLFLASGSGAIAIDCDASNARIATGNQNIIGDRNTVIYIYGAESQVIKSVVDRYSVIDNTFQQLFPPSKSSGIDWDWGMKLLKQKQLPEIRKRLTDTLGRDRTLMDISIEEQQNWVNRSPLAADRTLQINGKDCGRLDANKMLIETFGRDDIEGKLLILGAPGAGKTTALLTLAEQLVYGAISQPRTVIPVIFELSTWQNDQDIEAWLIEQLYDIHKGDRRSNLYEQWLEQQVLLPLMDGLDELELNQQRRCTEKLNEFANAYPYLVVCCRIQQFETVDIRLRNLRGAVCLQPLSDSQIQNYFNSLNRQDIWEAIHTDPLQDLLKLTIDGDPGLLRVPLFVNLLDAYDLHQPIKTKADLLDNYIDRQLSFDKRAFDRTNELEKSNWAYKKFQKELDGKKTRSHLRWVAQNLQADNKIDFLVEHLQPSLIDSLKLQYYYPLFFWVIFFVLFSLLIKVGVILREIFNLILVISITPREIFNLESLIFLSIIWMSREIVRYFRGSEHPRWLTSKSYKTERIEAVEDFQFSKENVIRRERIEFLLKVLCIVIIAFLVVLVCDNLTGICRIFPSFMGVVILNLIIYVINLTKKELKLNNREKPNHGIRNSFYNYMKLTVIIYVIDVFCGSQLPAIFLPVALLISFFVGGGKACLQHLSLRIVLWESGLPWNFAQFLNYCVERRLLLRVGGSYRFLHRELLDHFAQSNY